MFQTISLIHSISGMLFQLYFFGPVNIYECVLHFKLELRYYIELHRENFLDIPASGRLFVEQAN